MIKSGTVKSVLLLAFIGAVLVALVEPIAGHTMGQGKTIGQKDMMAPYPDNKSIIQSSMGEHAAKGTYSVSRTVQNASLSNINVDCARFWLEKAIELHKVHLKNPKTATNESQMKMMDQMTRAYKYLTGGGTTKEKAQNVSLSNINVDCARFWLEKAIKLHEVHLKNPNTATNESQMKMMDQMMRAYKYIKGENVPMKTINMTGSHAVGRA